MKTSIAFAVALFTSAGPAGAQQLVGPKDRYEIGQAFSLDSERLGEERTVWIHLPESYDDSTYAPRRYPVLYLLDGGRHFHSATGVVHFMSAGINMNLQIPEMIVVAIPNTDRSRDLTPPTTSAEAAAAVPEGVEVGGADRFLAFLTDELIPVVDARYRTRPYRILVGHSFGGLFALHALVGEPDAFQAYVAIDPSLWWDQGDFLARAKRHVADASGLKAAVFIASAGDPTLPPGAPNRMLEAARDFAASAQAVASATFRPAHLVLESEEHSSIHLRGLYHGLLHVFDGYRPSLATLSENPATDIPRHFRRVSERIGLELLPPEPFVDLAGRYMMRMDRKKDAIALFELNVANYPGSAHAYYRLGAAHAAAGNVAEAIASLEKAQELAPSNEDVRRRLEALRGGRD